MSRSVGYFKVLRKPSTILKGESVQDKLAKLKARYNAGVQALKAEERAAKPKAKTKAKAASKAKAKANAKAGASSRCPEAEAQEVLTEARPAPVDGMVHTFIHDDAGTSAAPPKPKAKAKAKAKGTASGLTTLDAYIVKKEG